MHVDTAVKQRISIRQFTADSVSDEAIRDMLEVARWSPSGGNTQPWHVHVLNGAGMTRFRAAMAAAAKENPFGEDPVFPIYPEAIKEPYRWRRFKCGEDLYATIGIPREDKMGRLAQLAKNYDFFGAPAAFFFSIDRQMGPGQWAHLGMFMQTLALVAEARGLGTCMQEAWMRRHALIRSFFGIPEEHQIYCGMAIGHPDRTASINTLRTERAPVDEFATFVNA